LVLLPIWQSEDQMEHGTLLGWCWIHRQAGLLPGA
jgi:hypothetical protein